MSSQEKNAYGVLRRSNPKGSLTLGVQRKFLSVAVLVVFALLASACASKRPVLYPNARLSAAGPVEAENDVDHCMQLARRHGADKDRSARIAKNTAQGAAIGGAAGGAAGAVRGRPGIWAAAGAAGGAAGAMTRSMLNSGEPDQVFRSFVEKCLRDKGYAPIGWR